MSLLIHFYQDVNLMIGICWYPDVGCRYRVIDSIRYDNVEDSDYGISSITQSQ